MLLPIGDEPNEHHTPWANYGLILANVLVFVVYQAGGEGPRHAAAIARHAYVPADPSLESAFVSMFLHGSWLHLLGNMLYLWIFGDNVEARLGHLGFVAAYLATGLAAGMAHGWADPSSGIPSLGASGAISGVQGLYIVAFPRNRVRLLLWFFFYLRVILVPAPFIVLLWFFLQDLIPVLNSAGDVGGVAHWAHLGGFAAGVGLCLGLRLLFPRRAAATPAPRPTDPRAADAPYARRAAWQAREGVSGEILGLWRSGAREQAGLLLVRALARHERVDLPEADYLEIGLWLDRQERPEAALAVFRGYLEEYPRGRHAPIAALGAGLLLSRRLGDPVGARGFLLEASSSVWASPDVRDAARRELERLGADG